jgi:hypothetical protein
MITDDKITAWLLMLGTMSNVLLDARVREDWPSDNDAEVEALITAISDQLDLMSNKDKLSDLVKVDDATLLGVIAMFSFPRAVRLIQLIGETSSSKLTRIFSKSLITDEQSAKYINILYARISYLSKTYLLFKIFNKERSLEITTGIRALALREKNLHNRNSNHD